jgi:hypothetical protein
MLTSVEGCISCEHHDFDGVSPPRHSIQLVGHVLDGNQVSFMFITTLISHQSINGMETRSITVLQLSAHAATLQLTPTMKGT